MLKKEDLEHGFKDRAHDLNGLFYKTNKISTFMNKLEKQSILDTARYDSKKYLGDGFEFLVEILLKTHSYDNRFGITNYTPIQSDDTGVDGLGLNLAGEKSVIQIKYKSNTTTHLTANTDHLSNMFSAAQTKYGISSINSEIETLKNNISLIGEKKVEKRINELEKSKKVKRHYVITTASGLHNYTDSEMYKNEVICIGFEDLRSLLDDNISFWNLCREISNDITISKKK
jgi:hypothetical protein